MLKITLPFNKIYAYILLGLGLSAPALAQCPSNISVNNTPGSCGAAVTYAVTPTGGAGGQTANGVVNPSAGSGFGGWTVSTGTGQTWVEAGAYFLSSYNVGTMSQVIDLTTMGLTDAYMDTQPAITVSEDYIGWMVNYADYYSLTVQLRGESDNIIATYTTGTLTTSATLQTAGHVFTGYGAGVRKVYIAHTGDDAEYWAGNYGAAVTNVQCTVAIPTGTVTQTAGLPSGSVFPIGTTTNSFNVTDINNVSTTCSFDVTVTDNEAPVITVVGGGIVYLDYEGEATLNMEGLSDLSGLSVTAADNCTTNTVTMSMPETTFNCDNLGMNAITVTATDGTNTSTQVVYVNVVDAIDPILALSPPTIQLNAEGVATLTAEDFGEGSSDNCGIVSFTFSQSSFTCQEMGQLPIMVTIADASGNTASDMVIVTVVDAAAPVLALQDATLVLDENGWAALTLDDIDAGSTDNCGIDSFSFSQTEFTCEDSEVTVTVTAIDNSGNVSTGEITVTVTDDATPVAVAQNLTVALGEDGTVTVNAMEVGSESTDNCAITTWELDNATFSCDNLGDNTVTLTIADGAGHTATATATVTVTDPDGNCETSGTARNFANALTLYPNPASSQLTIAAGGYAITKAEVYDLNGRPVQLATTTQNGSLTADVSALAAGVYMVKLYSADGVAVKKLVKE